MRRNHISEGAAKFLFGTVIILVACVGIGLTMYIMNEGKEGTNKNMAQYTSLTSQYTDVEREKYDGMEVSGSELMKVITNELEKNEISVEYATLASTNNTVAVSSTLTLAATDVKYINPFGVFKGSVTKDPNGVITTLTFIQIKK